MSGMKPGRQRSSQQVSQNTKERNRLLPTLGLGLADAPHGSHHSPELPHKCPLSLSVPHGGQSQNSNLIQALGTTSVKVSGGNKHMATLGESEDVSRSQHMYLREGVDLTPRCDSLSPSGTRSSAQDPRDTVLVAESGDLTPPSPA